MEQDAEQRAGGVLDICPWTPADAQQTVNFPYRMWRQKGSTLMIRPRCEHQHGQDTLRQHCGPGGDPQWCSVHACTRFEATSQAIWPKRGHKPRDGRQLGNGAATLSWSCKAPHNASILFWEKLVVAKIGEAGSRNQYLSHAKRALYQMSYIPKSLGWTTTMLSLRCSSYIYTPHGLDSRPT